MISDIYYPSESLVEVKTPQRRKGVLLTVEGPFGMTEKENKNRRVYTNSLWRKVLANPEIQTKLKERAVYGEPDHPQTLFPALSRVSHIVTELWLDERKNVIMGKADVLDTPNGRIIEAIYRGGGKIGISSRGAGATTTQEGKSIVDENDYKFGGFDFVIEPSNPNAYPLKMEAIQKSISTILTESIDHVSKDEEFYRKLLEKISPEGNVKLEWDNENLVVLHKGESLMENTSSITKEGPVKEDTTQKMEFYKNRLDELKKLYKKLQNKLLTQPSVEEGSSEQLENLQRQLKHVSGELDDARDELNTVKISLKEKESVVENLKGNQKDGLSDMKMIEIKETLTKTKVKLMEERTERKTLSSKVEILSDELNEAEERLKTFTESSEDQSSAITELETANMNLYVLYRAAEVSLDEDVVLDSLPDNHSRKDVDKVVEMLINSQTHQRQEEGLPVFSHTNSTKRIPVIVETQGSSKSQTRKRVSDMLNNM